MSIVLGALLPVGSVIHSMLTEAQFQAQAGSGWVLANGRSAAGSVYNTITGAANIPDARDTFLRAKGNGRGLNPDGDLALGVYTTDKFASHSHSYKAGQGGLITEPIISGNTHYTIAQNSSLSGGNETAPKSLITNVFFRMN